MKTQPKLNAICNNCLKPINRKDWCHCRSDEQNSHISRLIDCGIPDPEEFVAAAKEILEALKQVIFTYGGEKETTGVWMMAKTARDRAEKAFGGKNE